MRKNTIEPKKKPVPVAEPTPIYQRPEVLQPKPDSWTYQNFGPGGYIDAQGVPCQSQWD